MIGPVSFFVFSLSDAQRDEKVPIFSDSIIMDPDDTINNRRQMMRSLRGFVLPAAEKEGNDGTSH